MRQKIERTLRKLGQAALFSPVRSAAAAAGTSVIAAIIWAIYHANLDLDGNEHEAGISRQFHQRRGFALWLPGACEE
jgi:hypothetical protein